jgi:hypothetical protein
MIQSIGSKNAASAQHFLYVPLLAFAAADGCLKATTGEVLETF